MMITIEAELGYLLSSIGHYKSNIILLANTSTFIYVIKVNMTDLEQFDANQYMEYWLVLVQFN